MSFVLEEGKLLAGKYRLMRPAGFGGMAQLWVATNEATGGEVCVKVFVPERDDETVTRFRREAHAAARLSHRAIVRVFDLMELGEDGALATEGNVVALAIVMELLNGETLGDLVMKRTSLPLDEALDIVLPVVSALAYAHRAGIVHRDLKPDNVFLAVDPDGHLTPKVLDFGVSKVSTQGDRPITLDGEVLGTPSFMSPEQARGARSVDARSDVFSIAIVIYLMVTGKNPFEAERFDVLVKAILEREVERPSELPDAVWNVLAKALEKDPAKRWNDATELGAALRSASGRKVLTESSGRISLPQPASDSISVPPTSGQTLPSGAITAVSSAGARARLVPIVVAVTGTCVVLGIAAVLVSSRADTPSNAESRRAATALQVSVPPTAGIGESGAPALSPSSAAFGTAAPSASASASASSRPSRPATSNAPSVAASVKREGLAPSPKAGPRGPKREPTNTRDPGF